MTATQWKTVFERIPVIREEVRGSFRFCIDELDEAILLAKYEAGDDEAKQMILEVEA